MSLWLCLRLDQLPLQCLERREDQPVAVLAGRRVLRANDCAATLGIRQGMGTASVRTLAGDQPLLLLERDEAAERRCLERLCCWAYGITPHLCSWRTDCLQLEIGGCLTLFRGLDNLLAEVSAGLGSRGYRAQRALAPTPGAAWLLSFASPEAAMALERPLAERLAPLPLGLLEDFPATVDSLRRAGLHALGDILALPERALGRRCGREFTRFLQQVLGRREDLRPDYRPPATFHDACWFGYEVKANGELLPAVQRLLQSLCAFLRNTQLQTGELAWELVGVDGALREVCVRSGECHTAWEHWYHLTRIRFENLQLAGGVEGLALACRDLRPGESQTIDLFTPHHLREPLGNLLDRLRNRLGLQAVEQIGCRDEHLPELAVHVGTGGADDSAAAGPHCAQRPFWLMPQPQALGSRRRQLRWNGPLRLVYGPERIEDNWWQEAVSRDYYIAEGGEGQYYWVFRDRLGRGWHIHGIFA